MSIFNIVLLEPEIPQNTGNIIRTIACTGAKLHLIKPLGFDFSDKQLKRAGMDYFSVADVSIYENYNDFLDKNPNANIYYLTTKGKKRYSEFKYQCNDYFMFGKESKGIPEEILHNNYNKAIRIPMTKSLRSLNLSNAVAIVLYEAERQVDFEGLEDKGSLTKY